MSHDFAFWDSAEPLENVDAGEIFTALTKIGASERVMPSPKIAILAREIEARWPMPDAGREDEWPLSAPAFVSECFVIVCLAPSRIWDVWPALGEFAKQHELVMYDPQQQHVFLPPKLSRKRTMARSRKKQSPDS